MRFFGQILRNLQQVFVKHKLLKAQRNAKLAKEITALLDEKVDARCEKREAQTSPASGSGKQSDRCRAGFTAGLSDTAG